MGKKKQKKKTDTRGYGSNTTKTQTTKINDSKNKGTSKEKVTISKNTHDNLIELLDDLKVTIKRDKETNGNNNKKRADWNSVRFISKLTNIYDKLIQYGFNDDHINQVVKEIGGIANVDFSIDSCLDWFCLNLPSTELPSKFTEILIDDAKNNDDNAVTVIVADKTKRKDDNNTSKDYEQEKSHFIENRIIGHHGQTNTYCYSTGSELPSDEKSTIRNPNYKEKEEDDDVDKIVAQTKKDLLLQKYQYDENEELSTSSDAEKNNDDTGNNKILLLPEEKQLQELKQNIILQENELNDDVATYMRSKYETKDLQKQIKQLKNEVRKLEGQISKIHAESNTRQQEAKEDSIVEGGERDDNNLQEGNDETIFSLFDDDDDNHNDNYQDNDDDDDDQGMFSLFDEDDAKNEKVEAENSHNVQECASEELPTPQNNKIPTSPAISKNWTGTTPKKYLEEYCQRHKYAKPKFQQLYSTGYQLTVSKKGKNNPLIIDNPGPFYNFNDAKEYLATQLLYELNPTLPLYRILPPTFSSLWKSWLEEKHSMKSAEVEKVKKDKKSHIMELARLVAPTEVVNNSKKDKLLDKNSVSEVDNDDLLSVGECWDEDNEIPATNQRVNRDTVNNGESEILLQEFLSTQNSTKYKKMKSYRCNLPMYSFRQELLDTIANNQVTILCAETGAGKSTQCGQYILENCIMSGSIHNTNIICTQPRRISAISLAERVADEMCNKIGDIVGYHIRMESRKSRRTKLLFCTTGVILRRLQDDPTLEGVSVVIVDEVHERQWQIDFLLIALRELIRTKRKDLKVVLMSATLDSRLFSSFFNNAPFLSVPGRTFPVASYFLEDLIDATDHVVEEGSRYCTHRKYDSRASSKTLMLTKRGGDKRREVIALEPDDDYSDAVSNDYIGYKMATRRSMDRVDEQVINYDLIEDVLHLMLITPEKNKALFLPSCSDIDVDNNALVRNGSVLIFLPGMGEIRTLSNRLKGNRVFGDSSRFDIIPMHSTLSPKDQKRAFIKPRKGCQKIIIATNIAETSITIPDVVCVIDSGLVREVRMNKRSMTSMLATDHCSKASAKQRTGRAGRIQPGICCRLYSSKTFQYGMKDQAMPELQRVPLEEVCLSILAGGVSTDCMDFLLQAPQPPSEQSVQAALSILEEVGAIDSKVQKLTTLGMHLARLPVHVRLGKMLIFGVLFQCLDRVLTICATLSSKSPFSANIDNGNEVAAAHKTFANPTSDFLTICNVWEAFQLQCEKGISIERRFCDRYHLNWSALTEIRDTRQQFFDLLCNIGFVHRMGKNISNDNMKLHNKSHELTEYNTHNGNEQVVNAVICAGLYPNIAHGIKTESNAPLHLWCRKERVYFHSSSVNANAATLRNEWVVFYEKFETHRTYIAATSQVNPFALLLFGGPIAVKHADRLVTIDEWITLKVAAQTGVIFRELRCRIDILLKEIIEQTRSNAGRKHNDSLKLLKKVAQILACE